MFTCHRCGLETAIGRSWLRDLADLIDRTVVRLVDGFLEVWS